MIDEVLEIIEFYENQVKGKSDYIKRVIYEGMIEEIKGTYE